MAPFYISYSLTYFISIFPLSSHKSQIERALWAIMLGDHFKIARLKEACWINRLIYEYTIIDVDQHLKTT